MGPRRGSWDWSSHVRRAEDDRDRDDPWRNGGSMDDERLNGRSADRRKSNQKPSDHMSARSADERGGEGMRGGRDWHHRGSPQGMSFNSYRSSEADFYVKEQAYKSDKPPRPQYQRHEAKPKRRGDAGDYHSRSRHSDFEMSEEALRRSEDRRQSSPGRSRSRRTSRRHASAEKHEREHAGEKPVSTVPKVWVTPESSLADFLHCFVIQTIQLLFTKANLKHAINCKTKGKICCSARMFCVNRPFIDFIG